MTNAPKRMIVLTVFGTFFVLFFVFHAFFFLFHPTKGAYASLSRLMVIPAAVVSDVSVPYGCVARGKNDLVLLYPEEKRSVLFERALARCIYNAGVKSVALELDVAIGADPLILAQQTEIAVLKEENYQAAARDRLLELKTKFSNGMPFADAARKYSEDVSGGDGGDLGVFYLDAIPLWLSPGATLEDGEVSDVLEGVDAYWIISPVERGGEGEQEWVRLSGIAAKKVTLRKVLDERTDTNPPWVFVW